MFLFLLDVAVWLCVVLRMCQGQNVHDVIVDTVTSPATIDSRFLSVTLNTNIFHRTHAFDVDSEKIKNMAKALNPASLRIGGIRAGLLYFQTEEGHLHINPAVRENWENLFGKDFWDQSVSRWGGNHIVTAQEWSEVMDWAKEVGWNVTMNLNQFQWDVNYKWEFTNVLDILEYSASKGYEFEAFQLTNEPNSHDSKFGIWVTPEQTAADFAALRAFLDTTAYKNAKIIGPDITTLARLQGAKNFIRDWLKAGAENSVDALTMHQYYVDGPAATLDQFVNVTIYEQMQQAIDKMRWVQETYGGADLPIIISETNAGWNGGSKNLTNAFCSTFIFLHQLAVCALNGVERINRQDYWSGYYGLLDYISHDPNPDYWLAVLFKRLVAGPVLTTTLVPTDSNLFVFANCARKDGTPDVEPGDVVLYYLNVNFEAVHLHLNQFHGAKSFLLYQLSSIDGPAYDAMRTNKMLLNGVELKMDGDVLPSLEPVSQSPNEIIEVEAMTVGFIVVKGANIDLCQMN